MIRITYVTITYNAAKVLQRTLDSVLSQDYPHILHLIIDGASTDDTLLLVDDYIERSNAAKNGHLVQVTSEPDKGIYDAMNKGLRSLDGDYVCFLNAGDFLPSSDTVTRIVEKVNLQSSARLCRLASPRTYSTIITIIPASTAMNILISVPASTYSVFSVSFSLNLIIDFAAINSPSAS